MITEDEMQSLGAGCKAMVWNNGAFSEWYLAIRGSGLGFRDSRLSVMFNEYPGDPVKVYLNVPGVRVRIKYCETLEDFLFLYRLLTGKSVKPKRRKEKKTVQ